MSDLATTVTVIDACGRAAVPVLLLSDPGMGKSSLVRGIAAAEGVPCETVLGSIREPANVAGLPLVTSGMPRIRRSAELVHHGALLPRRLRVPTPTNPRDFERAEASTGSSRRRVDWPSGTAPIQ